MAIHRRAIAVARSGRLRLASLREHLSLSPAPPLASSHATDSSRANIFADTPSRRHSSASHPPPPSSFLSASHRNHPCDLCSHRNPVLIRLVATRSSPQRASPSTCHHHYHNSRTPLVHGPGLSASSALLSRLLHSSRAVAAAGSEPPVAGERSGPSGERAAGGEESVGDLRVSYGATEVEEEEAERRGNSNDGREEGRGSVWDEVREEDRNVEARGGLDLADGEKQEMRTRQRRVRVRKEAGGEGAAGGGTAEEGRSREGSLGNIEQGSRTNEAVITAEGVSNAEANNDDDDDDMSRYSVASKEDLRNAKQIADAILSGRFFAGMSRGKRHWAGDDVGESGNAGGEDGGVRERGRRGKEMRGEGRGEVGGDDEEEEEWRRSFRKRGWRPGFRGLGDWLGEAGGGQAEAEGQVAVEKQRFARVALVGAPNAGKSALMNRLVGVKVSAVSRKANTTQREEVGIRTTGPTQLVSFEFSHALTLLVFHDTPGLTVALPSQPLSASQRQGSLLALSAALHCHVVALVIDADWRIRRPDPRVRRMVGVVGAERREGQQRVAVLNKVDLVKDKRLLLPLAQELSSIHSIKRVFMVSALQDKGVNLLEEYLFDHVRASPALPSPLTCHATMPWSRAMPLGCGDGRLTTNRIDAGLPGARQPPARGGQGSRQEGPAGAARAGRGRGAVVARPRRSGGAPGRADGRGGWGRGCGGRAAEGCAGEGPWAQREVGAATRRRRPGAALGRAGGRGAGARRLPARGGWGCAREGPRARRGGTAAARPRRPRAAPGRALGLSAGPEAVAAHPHRPWAAPGRASGCGVARRGSGAGLGRGGRPLAEAGGFITYARRLFSSTQVAD
ncbi:unnamed protein product [Closterium sp. Naga37s-1]|nr:unnamed protein product [Closterium sp. Naga37s-1]